MCSIKVVIIHLTRVRETFYLKEKNKIRVNSSVKIYLEENSFDLQRKGHDPCQRVTEFIQMLTQLSLSTICSCWGRTLIT